MSRHTVMSRSAVAALLALCNAAPAQAAATLKGVVLINQLGGKPGAGVQVVADGANPTASDSTGRFLLGFPGRKPGDTVRLIVVREGWVVVNDSAQRAKYRRILRRLKADAGKASSKSAVAGVGLPKWRYRRVCR